MKYQRPNLLAYSFLFLVFLPSFLFAQTEVTYAWQYANPINTRVNAIDLEVGPEFELFIHGDGSRTGGPIFFEKRDKFYRFQWGYTVPEGQLITTLDTGVVHQSDSFLIKFSATGNVEWTLEDTTGPAVRISFTERLSDGTLLIGRKTPSSLTSLHRIRTDGTPIWSKEFGGFDALYCFPSVNAGFLLVGTITNRSLNAVMRLDSSGNIIQHTTFPLRDWDMVVGSNDESIYFSASRFVSGANRFYLELLRLTPNMDTLYERVHRFDNVNSFEMTPSTLVENPNLNLFIMGGVGNFNSGPSGGQMNFYPDLTPVSNHAYEYLNNSIVNKYLWAPSGHLMMAADGAFGRSCGPNGSTEIPFDMIGTLNTVPLSSPAPPAILPTPHLEPRTNYAPFPYDCGCEMPVSGCSRSCNNFPVAQFSFNVTGNSVTFINNSNPWGGFPFWDFGDGSTSGAAYPTHVFPGPGTYQVTLIEQGCPLSGSDTITQSVTIGTTAPVISGPIQFCMNTLQVYTVTTGQTYSWSAPGGVITSGQGTSSAALNWSTVGNYLVICDVTTNGQTLSDTLAITVDGLSLLPALGSDTAICPGTSLVLDPGNFSTYLWDDQSTNATRSVSQAGTYSVIVTNANGCIGTDSITIGIAPHPQPNLGPDTSICQGNALTLSPGTFGSYLWENQSMAGTRTVTQIGMYSVTVENADGCMGSDTMNLTLFPLPQPNLGQDTTYCGSLTTALLLSPGSFSTYLWDDQSINSTRSVSQAGMYSVSVEDANGCAGRDTISLTELPQPQPDLGPDTSLCLGGSLSLAPGLFNTYLWSDLSTGSTLSVTQTNTYSVEVTDANGCQNSDSIWVEFRPVPIATFSPTIAGQTVTFQPANLSGLSYDWDFGEGTTSSQMVPTHTYATPGDYWVCLTVTDSSGCSAVQCDSVTVLSTSRSLVLSSSGFKLYPNPATAYLTLVGPSEWGWIQLSVWNVLGKEIDRVWVDLSAGKAHLSIQDWPSGVLFLRVEGIPGQFTLIRLDP